MDRLEQLERARTRVRRVTVVKPPGEDRYLTRSQTDEPASELDLGASPQGHVRCAPALG